MSGFLQALDVQRWDDHRYYHHSRVNQSLHLLSALSFLCAYVLLFTRPAAAALLGWLFAMLTRQAGPSSSSRRATTRPTGPRTSTRSASRSVTTCVARSCC